MSSDIQGEDYIIALIFLDFHSEQDFQATAKVMDHREKKLF